MLKLHSCRSVLSKKCLKRLVRKVSKIFLFRIIFKNHSRFFGLQLLSNTTYALLENLLEMKHRCIFVSVRDAVHFRFKNLFILVPAFEVICSFGKSHSRVAWSSTLRFSFSEQGKLSLTYKQYLILFSMSFRRHKKFNLHTTGFNTYILLYLIIDLLICPFENVFILSKLIFSNKLLIGTFFKRDVRFTVLSADFRCCRQFITMLKKFILFTGAAWKPSQSSKLKLLHVGKCYKSDFSHISFRFIQVY